MTKTGRARVWQWIGTAAVLVLGYSLARDGFEVLGAAMWITYGLLTIAGRDY